MTTWNRPDTPPEALGVYLVQLQDNGRSISELPNGSVLMSYWDGVDSWSVPRAFRVKDFRRMYRERMLSPVARFAWTGKPL